MDMASSQTSSNQMNSRLLRQGYGQKVYAEQMRRNHIAMGVELVHSPTTKAVDTFALIGTNDDVAQCPTSLYDEDGIALAYAPIVRIPASSCGT
jgi:hypothetical protein